MTTTADVDCDLTHAYWRLKHAKWADQPTDIERIRTEINALLETRFTLTGGRECTPSPSQQ